MSVLEVCLSVLGILCSVSSPFGPMVDALIYVSIVLLRDRFVVRGIRAQSASVLTQCLGSALAVFLISFLSFFALAIMVKCAVCGDQNVDERTWHWIVDEPDDSGWKVAVVLCKVCLRHTWRDACKLEGAAAATEAAAAAAQQHQCHKQYTNIHTDNTHDHAKIQCWLFFKMTRFSFAASHSPSTPH